MVNVKKFLKDRITGKASLGVPKIHIPSRDPRVYRDVIKRAFEWKNTPEKHKFWEDIVSERIYVTIEKDKTNHPIDKTFYQLSKIKKLMELNKI